MPSTQSSSKAQAEVMAFLAGVLAGGAVPATQVGRMALEHGLTPKAVRSAREALGIKIERHGFGPGSHSAWSLPTPQSTKAGYEIIGLAYGRCDYCDARAGPPGPQSGPVYLVRNPFAADLIEPLHEDCAEYWFEWLSKIPKEICDRMLSGVRARMLKGAGGHRQV